MTPEERKERLERLINKIRSKQANGVGFWKPDYLKKPKTPEQMKIEQEIVDKVRKWRKQGLAKDEILEKLRKPKHGLLLGLGLYKLVKHIVKKVKQKKQEKKEKKEQERQEQEQEKANEEYFKNMANNNNEAKPEENAQNGFFTDAFIRGYQKKGESPSAKGLLTGMAIDGFIKLLKNGSKKANTNNGVLENCKSWRECKRAFAGVNKLCKWQKKGLTRDEILEKLREPKHGLLLRKLKIPNVLCNVIDKKKYKTANGIDLRSIFKTEERRRKEQQEKFSQLFKSPEQKQSERERLRKAFESERNEMLKRGENAKKGRKYWLSWLAKYNDTLKTKTHGLEDEEYSKMKEKLAKRKAEFNQATENLDDVKLDDARKQRYLERIDDLKRKKEAIKTTKDKRIRRLMKLKYRNRKLFERVKLLKGII